MANCSKQDCTKSESQKTHSLPYTHAFITLYAGLNFSSFLYIYNIKRTCTAQRTNKSIFMKAGRQAARQKRPIFDDEAKQTINVWWWMRTSCTIEHKEPSIPPDSSSSFLSSFSPFADATETDRFFMRIATTRESSINNNNNHAQCWSACFTI